MTQKHRLSCLALVLVLVLLFTGCGAARTESMAMDAAESFTLVEPQYNTYASQAGGVGTADDVSLAAPAYGLKIIYTTSMDIQTKTYDESYAAILAAVRETGGYVAASESWGGFSAYDDSYASRSVYLTLRIPAENYSAFLAGSESFGNITNLNETTRDITTAYIDTESRLSSLRAQETRLLELMEKAATVEDIIAIQDMLTDVVYEIESLTATLNTYDNLVTFCTVDISLQEVTTITVHRTSFGGRLWQTLQESLRSILSILQELATALVFLLPYGLISLAVFFVLRAVIRRRRRKKAAALPPAAPPATPET